MAGRMTRTFFGDNVGNTYFGMLNKAWSYLRTHGTK
jgi:hypothetical protein